MRKGGSHQSSCATIANALGISKHEISQYANIRSEPLQLFPPLNKEPLQLDKTNELMFMTDLKQEFLHRFHESPFYNLKSGKMDVRRYTDKYRLISREPFEPHWDRLPVELNWSVSLKNAKNQPKRIRLDENKLLEKLSQKEEEIGKKTKDVSPRKVDTDDEDEDREDLNRPVNNEDEEEELLSDEDYQDGLNDYVDTYFDDGDGYGSDNNLDDDGYA